MHRRVLRQSPHSSMGQFTSSRYRMLPRAAWLSTSVIICTRIISMGAACLRCPFAKYHICFPYGERRRSSEAIWNSSMTETVHRQRRPFLHWIQGCMFTAAKEAVIQSKSCCSLSDNLPFDVLQDLSTWLSARTAGLEASASSDCLLESQDAEHLLGTSKTHGCRSASGGLLRDDSRPMATPNAAAAACKSAAAYGKQSSKEAPL